MIEQKIRLKSIKGGLRTALLSGIISAIVSAYATWSAYPESGAAQAVVLGGGSGFIIGTLIPAGLFFTGTFLINTQHLRRLPYYAYLSITIVMIMMFTLTVYFLVGLALFKDRITDTSQLILAFGLSAFLSITLSVANAIRQFAGPGVTAAIVSGKYHKAFETECAFVFVDLVSSTAMAERLGSIRFFRMINDFHSIVEACCYFHDGSLYKYLGDGAILVWNAADCQKAFEAVKEMRAEMDLKRNAFRTAYNEDVQFTAGVHAGSVITGEIGDHRKEIGYWGDAVNTAARIQAACKELGKSVLFSSDFIQRLPEGTHSFNFMGPSALRGKENPVDLYSAW